MLLQHVHVKIPDRLQPLLVDLLRKGPDEPQAAGLVREDAHDVRPPLQLLVEALKHVGGLQVLVMGGGKPVEGERLLDVLLHPVAKLRVLRLPFGQSGGEVPPGLGRVPPVVEPAELHQAVGIGLAGKMVERVAEEMDVASPPRRPRQDVADGLPDPAVPQWSSPATNSTPCSPRPASPLRKSFQIDALSRSASSTASTSHRPSQPTPRAMSTACDWTVPSILTFSYLASRMRYGYSSSSLRRANFSSFPSSADVRELTVAALKPTSQSSSVIRATFRVETPCTYISIMEEIAHLGLQYLLHGFLEKLLEHVLVLCEQILDFLLLGPP